MNFPLAIISPSLGTRSETFIYRQMDSLLPGKTVVVIRDKASEGIGQLYRFPYFNYRKTRSGCRWFLQSGMCLLRLSKFSPVQKTVKKYLRGKGIQVILCHYLDFSLRWVEVAHDLGVRFFAHAHGYDVSRSLRDVAMRREYLRLKLADGIITMSEISRQRLADLGLDESRIHVIPYGIDVSEFPVQHDISKTDAVRCISVGRMVAKKAPVLLLEAFRQALTFFPNLRLDYIGEGELFEVAKRFVQEHNLEEKVLLHGGQPNTVVQAMLNKANIFLQHSIIDPDTGDEEGLPVAILEAMGHGLPVVSTRHAGIPEAVMEGDTGYLVDEGDTKGMAECMVQLAKDSGLRSRFGQAGWQRAKDHFTWQRERQDLLKVLGLHNMTSGFAGA